MTQVTQDITERKRAEEALRRSEARWNAAIENLRGGAIIATEAEQVIYWNPAARRMHGFTSAQEGIGPLNETPNTFELWTPDCTHLLTLDEWPMRRIKRGEKVHGLELRLRRPNQGWERIVTYSGTMLETASGERLIFLSVYDLTEQRKAEAALRESEARFRAVFESSTDCILVWDRDYNYLYANQAAVDHVGTTRDKVIGKNIRDGLGHIPDFMQLWMARVDRAFDTGESFRVEDAMRVGDRVVHSESQISPIRDPTGKVFAVGVVYRDTTERKQAEDALRQSQETLARAQAVGQVGSWQLDIRHDILTWSDEGYRIFGIPKGTPLTYEVFLATVHPEDRQYVDTQWNASLKGQPYDLEHRIIVNGEVKWVREKAFLEHDADGNLVGGFGITQDVTQRRRAEEALRESEARFRILADGTPVVIWVHDKEAGLQFINRAYCEFFGVTVEQVAGGNWKPLVHPDDAPDYVGSFMNCHAQRREFHSQARVRRHDGQWRWIESSGAPRFSETGEYLGMAGSSVDITVRKEAEAVLARSKAELERLVAERTAKLQELVGELEHFSYTITHDMRAPLRTMRGFGQIVSEMCDEWGKTEAKDFLGRIMNSADRMDALIRDALNYSQTVRQELPLDDVDTGVLVRGMVDTYPELQACKANIHIEGKLPVVLGNEAGLTQCFSNLLGNAVKFVKPGQTPEIRIWAEERAGWARIWVEDNGIGISKDMLPRVFDMFSRASRSYEGTGIGLALVRKVSQRMGGRAGVESEEGKGSRFWVELKAGKTKPAAKVPESTAAEPSAGTVLYVEDDEGDALFMERAFTKKGLGSALRLVGDGRAAIEYLSGAGKYRDRRAYPLPAVVLLDLNLPEVPGFEVLKWMRNHPDFSATPVVVFSSSSRQDDQLKARELGANEFVAKPKSGLEFGGVVDGLREKWLSQAKTERNDSPVCSEIRLAGGQTADILHNL